MTPYKLKLAIQRRLKERGYTIPIELIIPKLEYLRYTSIKIKSFLSSRP